MCGEKRQELGRPEEFLIGQRVGIPATGEQVDKPKQKVGESTTIGSQISSQYSETGKPFTRGRS